MVVTYIYCAAADQSRIQVRCRNLADAINRSGTHRANLLDMKSFVENTSRAKRICDESDLLVVYRYLYDSILSAVQYWQARDKKVIVDFDQAVNLLPPASSAQAFWFEGAPLKGCIAKTHRIDPPPVEQFKWGLAILDAATTSSPRLADDWLRFTKTYTIPDYLNTDQYPALHQTHADEIWLGLGYRAQAESAAESGLLAALENVCRQKPQVKFMVNPVDAPRQGEVYVPRRFEEWVEFLAALDIGLMPICGDYDLRLGYYDLLEFMVSKIPWVASAGMPFQALSNYGRITQNTATDWESAILDMVERVDFHRRRACGSPFLFALTQNLGANLKTILNIYDAILCQ